MNYDQSLALSYALSSLGAGVAASDPRSPQYNIARSLQGMAQSEQARRQQEKMKKEQEKKEKIANYGDIGGFLGGPIGRGLGTEMAGGDAFSSNTVKGYMGDVTRAASMAAGGGGGFGSDPLTSSIMYASSMGGGQGQPKAAPAPQYDNMSPMYQQTPAATPETGIAQQLPRPTFTQRLGGFADSLGRNIYDELRGYRNPSSFNNGGSLLSGGQPPATIPSVGGRFSTISLSPEQQMNLRQGFMGEQTSAQNINDARQRNVLEQNRDSREQGRYDSEQSVEPLKIAEALASIGATEAGARLNDAQANRTTVQTISPQEEAKIARDLYSDNRVSDTAATIELMPYKLQYEEDLSKIAPYIDADTQEYNRARAEKEKALADWYTRRPTAGNDNAIRASLIRAAQAAVASNPMMMGMSEEQRSAAVIEQYETLKGLYEQGMSPDLDVMGQGAMLPGMVGGTNKRIQTPDGKQWEVTPDGQYKEVR